MSFAALHPMIRDNRARFRETFRTSEARNGRSVASPSTACARWKTDVLPNTPTADSFNASNAHRGANARDVCPSRGRAEGHHPKRTAAANSAGRRKTSPGSKTAGQATSRCRPKTRTSRQCEPFANGAGNARRATVHQRVCAKLAETETRVRIRSLRRPLAHRATKFSERFLSCGFDGGHALS